MVQFYLRENEKYSPSELAELAIDGGCGWIVLPHPLVTDPNSREEVRLIVELCREKETILTFEDAPELAEEFGVHGVYLSAKFEGTAVGVREKLGAEAFIGAVAGSEQAVALYERNDIDYAVLDRPDSEAAIIINDARKEGLILPIVMCFPNSIERIREMLALGANGVMVDKLELATFKS